MSKSQNIYLSLTLAALLILGGLALSTLQSVKADEHNFCQQCWEERVGYNPPDYEVVCGCEQYDDISQCTDAY